MKIVLVVLAVVLGAACVFQIDTGTLQPIQVAGAGVICAALAILAP